MSETTDIDVPSGMHIEAEPHDDAPPSGERQLTPREIRMAEIAQHAEEKRQSEMAHGQILEDEARANGLTFQNEEDAPPEAEAEAAPATPPPEQAAPATPAPTPTPSVQLHTVEVDGHRFEVTSDQYAELARFGVVAHRALSQQQQPQTQQRAPEPEPAKPLVDPEAAREAIRKIQYGAEDEAAEALTKFAETVISRVPTAPQVDQNAIIQRAVEQAQAHTQLLTDTATIRQEFSDIFEHEQRRALATMNVEAIRRRNSSTGHRQSEIEIYREAGNLVREAMGLSRPGTENGNPPAIQATPVTRDEVIVRKRAAPRQTSTVDRRSPAPETTRAPTGSEVVDQMRKDRGQPSMR